ncbi:MAG: glycosyltransferase family 4 protein [Aggregatilineales bacterium]
MNLLLFNLAVDADDPLLSFGLTWIARLAAHFERIDVLTMRAGRVIVPNNVTVYSIGKERGLSEPARAAVFYRRLAALLNARRYSACFAHMMPLFVAMGAPLLAAARVPITLWYTHRSVGWSLRAALPACQRVVTAVADSFPIPTPKLRVLGHGVDTDFFAPNETISPIERRVVHVARLMPIKHQATLLRAIAQIADAEACLVGAVPPEQDRAYCDRLEQLAQELGIADRVHFTGALPPEGVRAAHWAAAAAVNLSPPGLFDKAALESMAAAVPTIVSSRAFAPLLGEQESRLRIPAPDDANALAERLRALLALDRSARAAIGADLRARVCAEHSLDALIPRLVRVLITGEP